MAENVTIENEGISFSDIWKIIKKYWVGLLCIVSATTLLGTLVAFLIVPKKYQGEQKIYYVSTGDHGTVESNDIATSGTYVNAAFELLKTSNVYKKTAEDLKVLTGNDYDYKVLTSTVNVSKTNTLIISFSYSSRDINEIPVVVNTFAKNAKEFVKDQLKLEFVYAGDITADDIYDVSTSKFLVVGASLVAGLVFGLCYEFIANSLDKTIKDKKTIESLYGVRVIGMIPDIDENEGDEE